MFSADAHILGRAAIAGIPLTALLRTAGCCRHPHDWLGEFTRLAESFERFATESRPTSTAARNHWKAAASGYQVATYSTQLCPLEFADAGPVVALRERARRAYQHALDSDPESLALTIACAGHTMDAVLRWPANTSRLDVGAVVVLLNGLDSIKEAELHGFGSCLLEHGLAVCALDAPRGANDTGAFGPIVDLRPYANAIVSSITAACPGAATFGTFGVSFGGLMAAQLLAGSNAFSAAVMLSPPAFVPRSILQLPPLRAMICATFRCTQQSIETAYSLLQPLGLLNLPAPDAAIRIYATRADKLFPPHHPEALQRWAPLATEIRWVEAEHVGTTQFDWLLPEAADWLAGRLSGRKLGPAATLHERINAVPQ